MEISRIAPAQPPHRPLVGLAVALSLAVGSCGTPTTSEASAPATVDPSSFVLETTEFTTQPGKEQYLCYTQTLTEDVVLDRISWKSTPTVHHIIFNQLLAPEPEGWSECAALFRPHWQFTFAAATGDADLPLPPDTGVTLKKGSQVMVQLHLLNTGAAPATHTARLTFRKTERTGLSPVGIFALGKTQLSLPPHTMGVTSGNDCELPDDVDLFYVLPHMHYLGKKLTVEVGDDWGGLKEVYRVDPYSFDDQRIDPVSLKLAKGTKTRVTCTFDNPRDTETKFGESSLDEMCFAVFFARNREGVTGCSATPVTDNGACEPTANELGVGAVCHKGAKDCAKGLMCTADQAGQGDEGFCFKLGCESNEACGSNAVCCAPKEAGGALFACLPEGCVPDGCTPR